MFPDDRTRMGQPVGAVLYFALGTSLSGSRCGQRTSLIAFVTDQMAVGKILDQFGLGSPQAARPPPPAREALRVAEHGDGWGVPAQGE